MLIPNDHPIQEQFISVFEKKALLKTPTSLLQMGNPSLMGPIL
jgi:hypothetical protein